MPNTGKHNAFFSVFLSEILGQPVRISSVKPQGGGCINKAAVLETSEGAVFVKWNKARLRHMFEVEVKGLNLLRATGEIQIPEVIGIGDHQDESFLFLEMVEADQLKKDFYEDFGRRLANMHRYSWSHFGLDYDNFIGSLPQVNTPSQSWIDFFYEHRLLYQLEMAIEHQRIDRSVFRHFENLYKRLPEIMPEEPPALLHGDLWGGNILKGTGGEVTLIDPAVYYGHREMELAYTMLFDNQPASFYSAYHNEFPLAPAFEERVDIYNLYPLLVHVNLFGGGYAVQVKSIMRNF